MVKRFIDLPSVKTWISKLIYFSFLFIALLVFLIPSYVIAQKKENKIVAFPLEPNIPEAATAESILAFRNMNKLPFYFDKKKMDKIMRLDKEKNWLKLYKELDLYIRNFGIENFYKDTYWLWRYTKLVEHFGDHQKAKLLYKLVLKHHRNNVDIRKVALHYDSLNSNEKELYVPLEYYYELVEFRSQVDTLKPPRGILLNMGPAINSLLSDYGPTLNVHNNIMIFSSKR
ncbi:MAG: OmpA family protein, partial [Bacteroidota bacterium]|nr:OmpA family protein [Bacteroidota bacterium]